MDNPDCFALMLAAGSQANFTCCAISLEEVVIVPNHWCRKLRVYGVAITVEKLDQVELRTEAWHTGPGSKRQTCIDEVDFDADIQPGDDPQKGQ